MTNLGRRLKRLEAQFTDKSGLIPLSPPWMEYWSDRAARMLDGEDVEEPSRIPLAFADAVLAEAYRN
jgi:hypothetical protein